MKKLVSLLLLLTILYSCKEKTQKIEVAMQPLVDVNLSYGSIKRIENFPTKLIKPRNVDIWLPENYTEEKKYAVLYMHDGQMLFDASKTWNKQEWKVDEVAGKLQKEGLTKDFIVVAVHNISSIRWNDYFPAKAMNYLSDKSKKSIKLLGKKNQANLDLYADNYLKFLTQELKPFVDQSFSVFKDSKHTFIAGSSMGGLISMYAISEYPSVFGGAACISTHWPGAAVYEKSPLPKAIFAYMKENLPSSKNHKLYFDYGTQTLDQYYPQYAAELNKIAKEKGYDYSNFINKRFDGADHSENSWNQRLDIPLQFLLKK